MINGEERGEIAVLDLEHIWDYVIAVLLASAGGLARLLNAKDKTKFKWGLVVSELFVSGFSGFMILLFARAAGITGDWLGLVCGIAGWTSPRLLSAISKVAERILGLEKESKNNNEEEKK